jgi:hypothetical protein
VSSSAARNTPGSGADWSALDEDEIILAVNTQVLYGVAKGIMFYSSRWVGRDEEKKHTSHTWLVNPDKDEIVLAVNAQVF